jgi:hypothetical protein
MSYYVLSLQWRDPDETDQYEENVQVYQDDGTSHIADDVSKVTKGNDDSNNADGNDNGKSHIADDVRDAIN